MLTDGRTDDKQMEGRGCLSYNTPSESAKHLKLPNEPTRSETNQTEQPLKMNRGLDFGFRKKRDCTIFVAKKKTLFSCTWAFFS